MNYAFFVWYAFTIFVLVVYPIAVIYNSWYRVYWRNANEELCDEVCAEAVDKTGPATDLGRVQTPAT